MGGLAGLAQPCFHRRAPRHKPGRRALQFIWFGKRITMSWPGSPRDQGHAVATEACRTDWIDARSHRRTCDPPCLRPDPPQEGTDRLWRARPRHEPVARAPGAARILAPGRARD